MNMGEILNYIAWVQYSLFWKSVQHPHWNITKNINFSVTQIK